MQAEVSLKVEEQRTFSFNPIRNVSAVLHGLRYILLLEFREAASFCAFFLHLHSITVLRGSLSADQRNLTDAAIQERVTKSRVECCHPPVWQRSR